jgi:hypothetical protein
MPNLKKAKRQRRKVGVAGGFINQVMGNNSSEPKVGEGATILSYSDRDAYEVIEVSEDGLQCVIRAMDYKFIGQCYGDERYEYFSNPENHTYTLEWNEKKSCWGKVYYTVEIIKSLSNKYYKKYGWGCQDILLEDNGLTYDDLYESDVLPEDRYYNQFRIIDGVTKRYKNFDKVSIIFGLMEKYRDPHF